MIKKNGAVTADLAEVIGTAHWATKRDGGDNVRLWVWNKRLRDASAGSGRSGTVLFVHGSSMASTPVYDLQVPGRPEASLIGYLCAPGV